MNIAFIVYDGITVLDLIGVYDPICRLKSGNYMPELRWDICSYSTVVRDSFGLIFLPTKTGGTLEEYDAIIIPGGLGSREMIKNKEIMNWIKTAANARYKISVCSGSLILGAAGFLTDRKATTHFNEYENLKPYCLNVESSRIVNDAGVITAGAVAASIDLGLYLCNIWSGEKAMQEIKTAMNLL